MKTEILSRIVEVLTNHGSVSFVATIGGRQITVGVSGDPREAVSVKSSPEAWGGWAEAPGEMAAKVADGIVITSVSTEKTVARVMEPIKAHPIGLTLEELAKALDVRPRNRLKALLAALVKSGRLRKVGRRFRDADAVVRRGPRPREAQPVARRAISDAKMSALAKARAALAEARARQAKAKRGRRS